MKEEITKDNKLLKIFFMKDLDDVMNIIASSMTLDALDGTITRRYFVESSVTKETKHFTHRQPFCIH